MKAIDLIFRETTTEGSVRNEEPRISIYRRGMPIQRYEHMQNLLEAIFLNKVNK